MRILVNRLYPRGDGIASDAVHSNPNLAPRVFVDFGHDVSLGPLRNLIDITLHPRRAGLYCGGFRPRPFHLCHLSFFDPFPMSLVPVFLGFVWHRNLTEERLLNLQSRGQWHLPCDLVPCTVLDINNNHLFFFFRIPRGPRETFRNRNHPISKKSDGFVKQTKLFSTYFSPSANIEISESMLHIF